MHLLPTIWDGTVFLTSIEGAMKETLWVSAVSSEDGSERWRRRSFAASEQLEQVGYGASAQGQHRLGGNNAVRLTFGAPPHSDINTGFTNVLEFQTVNLN